MTPIEAEQAAGDAAAGAADETRAERTAASTTPAPNPAVDPTRFQIIGRSSLPARRTGSRTLGQEKLPIRRRKRNTLTSHRTTPPRAAEDARPSPAGQPVHRDRGQR